MGRPPGSEVNVARAGRPGQTPNPRFEG